MSHELIAQSRAAQAVRSRGHFVAIIAASVRQIQTQDHLLAQIQPGLTPHAWAAIRAELEAQDTRLADALTDTRGISDALHYEPDPHHPGALREAATISKPTTTNNHDEH